MTRLAILASVVAATLLSACATPRMEKPVPVAPPPLPTAVAPPAPEPPPVAVEPVRPVAVETPAAVRAMQFFVQFKQRAPREQKVEHDLLRKSFASGRTDFDRIRLALTLSVPGSALQDETQALELLEPLVRDQRNDYHDLAQLVTSLLTEQRRRAQLASALQQKLDRIMALEKEMQERATSRDSRVR